MEGDEQCIRSTFGRHLSRASRQAKAASYETAIARIAVDQALGIITRRLKYMYHVTRRRSWGRSHHAAAQVR